MGAYQMKSGQSRAYLARMEREGMDSHSLIREKRMGDLAWQMTMTMQKLSACPKEKLDAKERLEKLYDEAKAEYDRLVADIEIEKTAEAHGVYLG